MYCLVLIYVDECALNTDNCTQLCTNLVGALVSLASLWIVIGSVHTVQVKIPVLYS